MSRKTCLDSTAFSEEARDVATAEAVTYGSELGRGELALGGTDRGFYNTFDVGHGVTGSPSSHVESAVGIAQSICGHWITAEEIGHYDEVAGFGDAVGEPTRALRC